MAFLQMRKKRMVKTGELTGPLHLTSDQERELFRRMSHGGLIARVRPGLYLVPAQLPMGGSWSPDETLAINTLIEDRRGRYQICGPNAFNRYGFDNQVSNRVYAYNDRISGERTIGVVALTLIKVAENRLGATEEVRTADGLITVYSSRVRTLVDAVYDWSRFNSLPRAFQWVRNELTTGRITAGELVKITLQYGDKGTIRRMGLLLEREGVETKLLRKLERALNPSKGLIPFIPRRPKRGTANPRWGVVNNEET